MNVVNGIRAMFGVAGLVFVLSASVLGQSDHGNVPKEWMTVAEETGYAKTSTYAQAVTFAKRLDAASKDVVYKSYGKSGEGRDMPLLIAATGGAFTL